MVKIDSQVPERGDIIRLQFNPRTGSEQAGFCPAIVISPLAYNRISKLILVCPITSQEKGWPFEVKLPAEMQIQGVVLVDQIQTVDCAARGSGLIEKAPAQVVDEILARLEPLVG